MPVSLTLQILQPTYYDAIRHALDFSLDSNALPDAVIEEVTAAPAAEAEVLRRDPLATTYETTDAARWACVVRAVVYLTAARLAPALPALIGESLGDYRVSLKPPDLLALAATLRGRADQELSTYLNDAINLRGTAAPLPAVWIGAGTRRGY